MNRRQDCLLGFDVILYCSIARSLRKRSSIHGCGLNRNHLGRPTAVDRFQYLKRLKLSTFHFTIPFFFFFFKHLGCKCKCNDTDEVLLGTIQKRIRSENVPPVILFSWSCYPCAISFVDFFECVTRACQTSLARESWSNSWLAPLASLVPNRQVAGVGLSLNR